MASPTHSISSTASSTDADAIDPAGAELADKIIAFERCLEAACVAGGELDAAFFRARTAHKLSSVVGHPILSSFGAASASVVEALGHAVKGHRLTDQLAQRLGIFHAYGDGAKDSGDKKVFTGA